MPFFKEFKDAHLADFSLKDFKEISMEVSEIQTQERLKRGPEL